MRNDSSFRIDPVVRARLDRRDQDPTHHTMPRRAALRAAGSASRARLRLGFCSQERRTDTVSGAGSGEQRRKHAVGRFRRVRRQRAGRDRPAAPRDDRLGQGVRLHHSRRALRPRHRRRGLRGARGAATQAPAQALTVRKFVMIYACVGVEAMSRNPLEHLCAVEVGWQAKRYRRTVSPMNTPTGHAPVSERPAASGTGAAAAR